MFYSFLALDLLIRGFYYRCQQAWQRATVEPG